MGSQTVLANYQLADLLGKGASGQVYRALNWTTGETVAVKQISLANIPKTELSDIMFEIDLLKNLHHPNIVQYKGFVKTREFLYIILEYCENGSLHNFLKKFGKFPENLVAVYISQVLEGLVYLHEQGVIHRDIKSANILTNKDGKVMLADFGVAAVGNQENRAAVVGSPYWMAPEVIEQLGATTASDIWSVGSVVVELLEGKPPYYHLSPMPAMFRIVQDDCPPIPEGISPIVKDFLYHCFQKDPNLRISAKKLLRHPWMMAATKKRESERQGEGGFEDAVQKVQEWNEALKSPPRNTNLTSGRRISRIIESKRADSPTPFKDRRGSKVSPHASDSPTQALKVGSPAHPITMEKLRDPPALQSPEEQTDNWDDDFEEDIPPAKLHALDKVADPSKALIQSPIKQPIVESRHPDDDATIKHTRNPDDDQTIRPNRSPSGFASPALSPSPPSPLTPTTAPAKLGPIDEDYSDLVVEDEDEVNLMQKVAKLRITNGKGKLMWPEDIKTVGLDGGLAAKTAPLLSRSVRPSISPLADAFESPNIVRSKSFSAGSMSLGRATGLKSQSSRELQKYSESEDEDYDDVFGKPGNANAAGETLKLNTRLSNRSWLGDQDEDEDDPFAEIDESFDEVDLESNLIRDKYARLCAQVNQLIDELIPTATEKKLREALDQLLAITEETPELQMQVVSAHGMLAMLEVLESNPSRDVVRRLLHLINTLVTCDMGILESFCLIGGIPVVMSFTSKKFSTECRVEASNFVRSLCTSSPMTLQMFISCRGLKVLVDILDEDFSEQQDLVVHALNGVRSVFELQSPTPKNDFCRMFIREGLLDPLTSALLNIMNAEGEVPSDMKDKILNVILIFCQASQSDAHVRQALGTRTIIRRLLRAAEQVDATHVVTVVKSIRHLSMSPQLLDVLQNANTIEVLINILGGHSKAGGSTEIENHIFQTCFNLCRLNKSRQEEAASAGIIPHLKRVAKSNSPLKQFALPILCDLASAGKSCRKLLWQYDGLRTYLSLLKDPYFQVTALEAILSWLQDETARVEDVLIHGSNIDLLLQTFLTAKANYFENLLDPFLKVMRLSSVVTLGLSKGPLFVRLLDKLSHGRPVVRISLLRILRVACEVQPEKAKKDLVDRYKIWDAVDKLSRADPAVLVRELAREILPILRPVSPATEPHVNGKAAVSRGKSVRRVASSANLSASVASNGSTDAHSQIPPVPPLPKPRIRKAQGRNALPWRA
ncbi:Pkinase-domain-containing protein [Dacryopinax primogenitus]|uniref:non-specific serine/threonine protein kinase n=1 Tax=Dacryopinax primogenitus (strain DJM 731) TaxID=1858805 RepID=M5FZ55_DACPD|nr:Pkinase-domain-containing protein [Dacryopinax primogenitus]EJU03326.1 Pkinase-domain-containing protein [Dacryopinax primogenitus]